jgi:hypothetical protein
LFASSEIPFVDRLNLTDLEQQLSLLLCQDAIPIEEKVFNPDWDIDGWTEQIPDNLRELWGDLSLESKLVAVIVGASGVVISNDL